MSNCEIIDFVKFKEDVYYKENPHRDFRETSKKQIIVCKKFITIFSPELAILLCHIIQKIPISIRYDCEWFVRTEKDLMEEMPFFDSQNIFSLFYNFRNRKLLDVETKGSENYGIIYRFMFTDALKKLIVEVYD